MKRSSVRFRQAAPRIPAGTWDSRKRRVAKVVANRLDSGHVSHDGAAREATGRTRRSPSPPGTTAKSAPAPAEARAGALACEQSADAAELGDGRRRDVDGSRRRDTLSTEQRQVAVLARLTGELAHDWLDVGTGRRTATEWFVQGQHTLTPRWFVAARYEGVTAPPRVFDGVRPTLRMSELTAGFRLSREFTLRSSAALRKTYFSEVTSRQAGFSLVWAHRWR